MSGEFRSFDVPVLLATADKYQYLTNVFYEHLLSEPAHVSDLMGAAIDAIRESVPHLRIHRDSEMIVEIFELLESLGPVHGTAQAMKKQFEVVDDAYMEENARFFSRIRSMNSLTKPENVIAVLSVDELNAQIRREKIAAAARSRQSPSTCATAEQRFDSQKSTCLDALYNYRPLHLIPPPITIYHPVFNKFLQMMVDPQDFTHDELDLAQTFVTQAASYYIFETDRANEISAMSSAVHPRILAAATLSYISGELRPDGVVFSAKLLYGFRTVAAITQVKAEIGEGSCDPIAQAECAYVAIYSSDEALPVREVCCCPAFLIGIAGPNIIVSGAVFADTLIAQPLTDYISIVPRPAHNHRSPLDDAGYRVARLFRALRECIKDLDEYYAKLVQAISPRAPLLAGLLPARVAPASGGVRALRVPAMTGPNFTTYCDGAGKAVVLEYRERLVPHISMKTVFVAEAKSESETAKVVVKFAYAYTREAHELLAKASPPQASPPQAPKLRYCAYEPSVGMQVVVMDFVEGREVDGALTQPAHIQSLRGAIMTLHQGGFVFGDLRAQNVLRVGDGIVLVGFDWCGKEGEARYPSDILVDEQTLGWHRGVKRGGLIEKEHDAHLFRALTHQNLNL
ncbi:hypothetical protein WOLCODRAFT_159755 [Wolfiporia cocos MD-104 SS10]|uniref:Protein kinase domain-containing protein n=1 Tax=Wolfiporia cocos (strain MD-104) TaxID=742152 RepID=A0A2H3J2L8_WOLCO|nr:hypothetical protein WOLCODRAFT_159755 [Wolfiporia cocos MD-104 SS10]